MEVDIHFKHEFEKTGRWRYKIASLMLGGVAQFDFTVDRKGEVMIILYTLQWTHTDTMDPFSKSLKYKDSNILTFESDCVVKMAKNENNLPKYKYRYYFIIKDNKLFLEEHTMIKTINKFEVCDDLDLKLMQVSMKRAKRILNEKEPQSSNTD
jgi:hypothetical protein